MTRSHLHVALLLILAGCSADSSVSSTNTGGGGQNNKPDASVGTGGGGGTGGSDVTGGSGGSSEAGSGGTGGSAEAGQGGTPNEAGTTGGSGGVGGGVGGAAGSAAGGAAGSAGATGGSAGDGGVIAPNGFAVETNNYDNGRTGANTSETILNTSNVTATKFGLLFSRTIVGASYGQPLYVSGITVNGTKRNVVYVATEENNVYAFDADSPAASAPLWQKNLGGTLKLGAGGGYDPKCNDMVGSNSVVGITSTPVISVADNKIFMVSKGPGVHQLHSLDLATGMETGGSPAAIGAGMADFNSDIHLNRPGLLLANGVIYVGFGSHCDYQSYHGWIFGYDAKTLQKKTSFNATPNGARGAIWQSGVGLSTDGTDIFVSVGNGDTGGANTGFSFVTLSTAAAMKVTHQHTISARGDSDPSSGVIFLGSTNQVAAGGKDFNLYLMGKDLTVKQTVTYGGGGRPEVHSLAYWEGSAGPMLYSWPDDSGLFAYTVGAGTLKQVATNTARKPSHPGGTLTVSSNGATAGTGVLWASLPSGDAWHGIADGSLYAFDAANVGKAPLWNSNDDVKDDVGKYAKFSPPMVANGKVYLATFSGKLLVYGLK